MVKEGGDRNVCVFGPTLANRAQFLEAERFQYNLATKVWSAIGSGWAIDIEWDKAHLDPNVITHPKDDTSGQKWDIEYCS